MKTEARRWLLQVIDAAYQCLTRHLIFRSSAQNAHDRAISLLRLLERIPFSVEIAKFLHRLLVVETPTAVGGVRLSQRLILAAGLVKGDGFADESAAMAAVTEERRNIIPGCRILPALVGPVEFGSFTRHPRLGNPGTVVWRRAQTQSTQNRVGLRNPGARAAARFLAANRDQLPPEFGINVAVSPGVQDIDQQEREIVEALAFFLDARVYPTWFTLNISCPNTEDDPLGHQLEAEITRICSAFIDLLRSRELPTPLWVKISPGLAAQQYDILMRVFHAVGAAAVVATNTMAKPSPDDASLQAGIGGGELRSEVMAAIEYLAAAKASNDYDVDLIACGGILDGESLGEYQRRGVKAAQYWSAIVYRGPFAAAIIESEMARNDYEYEAVHRESLA